MRDPRPPQLHRPAPLLLEPRRQFLIELQSDYRVERRVIELLPAQWPLEPVAALVGLVQFDVEQMLGYRRKAVGSQSQSPTGELQRIDKAGRVESVAAEDSLVKACVVGGHDDLRTIDKRLGHPDPGRQGVNHHHPSIRRGELEKAQSILSRILVEKGLGIQSDHRLADEIGKSPADRLRIDQIIIGYRTVHNEMEPVISVGPGPGCHPDRDQIPNLLLPGSFIA